MSFFTYTIIGFFVAIIVWVYFALFITNTFDFKTEATLLDILIKADSYDTVYSVKVFLVIFLSPIAFVSLAFYVRSLNFFLIGLNLIKNWVTKCSFFSCRLEVKSYIRALFQFLFSNSHAIYLYSWLASRVAQKDFSFCYFHLREDFNAQG